MHDPILRKLFLHYRQIAQTIHARLTIAHSIPARSTDCADIFGKSFQHEELTTDPQLKIHFVPDRPIKKASFRFASGYFSISSVSYIVIPQRLDFKSETAVISLH